MTCPAHNLNWHSEQNLFSSLQKSKHMICFTHILQINNSAF